MSAATVQDKLARAIRKDLRKILLLSLLLVLLSVMLGRMGLSDQAGPARAAASTARVAPAPLPAMGHATSEPAMRPDDPAPELARWLGQPIPPLGRNLFAVKLDYFPRNGTRQAEAAAGGRGFWDELAKSLASRADEGRERQVLSENLRQQASQLRLQSTLMGPSPRAVINGAMVGEGAIVEGFRVLRIEPRRVIIEREGIRLEVPMS